MNASRRAWPFLLPLLFAGCSAPDTADSFDATPTQDAPPATDADTTAGWHPMAPVGGGPIQETGVAALGGKIYVVGGFNENLQIGSAVQVYDPARDTWSQAAPLPIAVHHANVAAVDGRLLVLGAMQLSGFSFVPIADSFAYAPASNSWTPLAPMPAGSERGAAAVGVFGNIVVLAGGLRNGAIADVVSYDAVANTWDTTMPSLPAPTDHLMGAALEDVMFVIGGRTGGIETVKNTVLSFRLGDTGWTEQAPMPEARGGAAAAAVAGKIVVVGGEGNSDAASGVFPQVQSYDPAADTWTDLPDMPVPRHGMGAAGIGNTLYVPGGATKQGFGATETSELYRF